MKTRPTPAALTTALAVVLALVTAAPAAADAVRWQQLDAHVSSELASGLSTSLASDNLKRTGDLDLVLWWSNDLSWNRYSYVLNNPLGFIDPNGEAHYKVLVGDPGLGDHNAGNNFERAGETRKQQLEAAGHTADVTRVSTVSQINTALTSGPNIDGGVVLLAHGGVLDTPSGYEPAIFVGEGSGADTNLTATNVGNLSNTNLGPNATIDLVACNSAGVAPDVATSLNRSTTGTIGSMSFSPDPNVPMSSNPGTTPPDTGPLFLVPDVNSTRFTWTP